MVNCPQCSADVTDTYERADYECGINPGWYCEACELGIGEHEVEREPLGVPISELSGQPGPKDDLDHPDHTRYENFCRLARSWGYE